MYSDSLDDSLDSSFPGLASGSRLMSESPLLPSSSSRSRFDSDTGPGGADLSLSELSLSDRPHPEVLSQPFSLLARPHVEPPITPPPPHAEGEHNGEGEGPEDEEFDEGDVTMDQAQVRRAAARTREEKLQSDLFILRKLNSAFAAFGDALGRAESANERVATQLEQTDALLNQYVGILAKSEDVAHLIFDEEWFGAEADEAAIETERVAAAEAARVAAEERARIAREEQERREREEREREEREEREEKERARQERLASRGGVRGVRGTRASMRGTRTAASTATGRGASSAGSSRPGSSAAGRGTSATGTGSGLARGTRARGGAGASGIPTRGTVRRTGS
ncbi:hypothetical protein HGRIS_002133 [Hohenbuehelia grisea]|uniref:DASH complex subunit DUO1 n=1 Tax=Hohenbuehelia grisea TaxID=104357 RepID=A0ABR3JJK0_9AGAR